MANFTEPVWVGMDVEAELARYEREDRRQRRERRALGVRRSKTARALLPLVGKEAPAPQSPQAA